MQGGVTDFLRFESSKFGDLPSIIMKLENQGYVREIHNLFLKLYEEEASFTLQELKRYAEQNQQNEQFDIHDQFFINTTIFKSNFQLILQMIVEHIWGSSSSSKPARGKENIPEQEHNQKTPGIKKAAKKRTENKSEPNSQSQGDQRTNIVNTPETQALSNRPESAFSRSNTGASSQDTSVQDSKLRSGSPSLTHLSVKNKDFMERSNRGSGGKAAGNKSNNQSKRPINLNPNPTSPLYTILYGDKSGNSQSTGNLHRAEISQINQVDRSTNSNLFDRSSVSNLSHLKNVNRSGLSVMKSNVSGNSTARNKSTLSVPSEFNLVKGPATFSTSQRKTIEINEMSPGPAAYTSERTSPSRMKRSPSPSFGKAAKGSWIDIVASQNPSPGPAQLYPSHQFVCK